MAKSKARIITRSKPTIGVDQIALPNRTGDLNGTNKQLRDNDEKTYGFKIPLVYMNAYSIDNYLTHFELDLNGIIPTLNFSFFTGEPYFMSVSYPKDGDIVSVYIRSSVEVYKPLRMDFSVLSVEATPSSTMDGDYQRFSILAECRIPGFYAEVCKSFRQLNSHDTLFKVSQDLNLGFSSNDTEQTDVMTWLCPSLSYYDFIMEVASRAYKDERSFYDVWVDPYYNLNFVNINKQIDVRVTDILETVMVQPSSGRGGNDVSSVPGMEQQTIEKELVITNAKNYSELPFYIIGYTMVSNAGNTTNDIGYIQEVQFYDDSFESEYPKDKYRKYTISPITTDNITENMVLQKGRAKENLYKKEIRKRWMGIIDNGAETPHANFIHAKIQNEINKKDVTKFTLQVELNSYFAGFYRGQSVPVSIYANNNNTRMQNAGNSNDGSNNDTGVASIDNFLSGVYIIMGLSVCYSPSRGMYQVLNLCKREWILNSAGTLPKFSPIDFSKLA